MTFRKLKIGSVGLVARSFSLALNAALVISGLFFLGAGAQDHAANVLKNFRPNLVPAPVMRAFFKKLLELGENYAVHVFVISIAPFAP